MSASPASGAEPLIASFALFGVKIRITPTLRDQVLVAIWFFTTFRPFRGDELLLYPLALYFCWAFIRDFPLLVDLIMRSLILWVFPIWWLLSLSWGADTAQIMKTGLQLLLTFMVCYGAVLRLTPRDIMLAILLPASFYGLLSLIAAGPVAARGVFASKNALGLAMVMLWVSALCAALDSRLPLPVRLFSVGAALLSLFMINVANSATAVLLALAGLLIIVSLLVKNSLSLLSFLALFCFLVGGIALGGAVLAFSAADFDPVAQVLGAFGKDTTLTGRTVLWQYAFDQIQQNPLLGVGAGGFWTPHDELSVARRIYTEFHKTTYSSFSFHNSYVEIAVHQGLIGAGIVITATLWCLWRTLLAAVMSEETPTFFFVGISMCTLAQSMTEIGLMMPFVQLSMLLVIGALFTLKRPVKVYDTPIRHSPISWQGRRPVSRPRDDWIGSPS